MSKENTITSCTHLHFGCHLYTAFICLPDAVNNLLTYSLLPYGETIQILYLIILWAMISLSI